MIVETRHIFLQEYFAPTSLQILKRKNNQLKAMGMEYSWRDPVIIYASLWYADNP
ncbi:MAG: hypothetical protein QNJ49_15405 [Mastigocoleus sp. MO_167.B18]|uniref:hypothetical protein n=1 Tax=Mastigocoleus sp. MO_188.B34 TaxID=3036635 RepID=UPI002639AA81|nr:hypothetical protein [Mastigocoleus sp. MO_188.B34]MDJ0695721.1 hypothetical protein [Mastigocoleus sp. MO_188.B34]MDJ0774789.1 hypothetical protein [Mastigocoleus sp. MO_167.B18]